VVGGQPLLEDKRIVASRDQVSCSLGVDAAILNLKNGVYYGLNGVGARIWHLLQAPRTFGELHDILSAEYEVEPAQLESDIRELLGRLAENHLVETCE
jgi:hypothetical protein